MGLQTKVMKLTTYSLVIDFATRNVCQQDFLNSWRMNRKEEHLGKRLHQ